MRNSRRTYKNGKYGVANWENPLTRYNKLYEPFDPMKGQRKKHKKLLKFLSEAFAEREGWKPIYLNIAYLFNNQSNFNHLQN